MFLSPGWPCCRLLGLPPLLYPMHVILLELVIDPVCSLVFEGEPSERHAMEKPPRPATEPLFGTHRSARVLQGTVVLGAVLGLYVWALNAGVPEMEARAVAFVALVLGNLVLAFADAAEPGTSFFDSRSSRSGGSEPGLPSSLSRSFMFHPCRHPSYRGAEPDMVGDYPDSRGSRRRLVRVGQATPGSVGAQQRAADNGMTRIALIQGHPTSGGHFCHALAETYAEGAFAGGHQVRLITVADRDFPLLRLKADWDGAPPPAAIAEAQRTIEWAEHLLIIYPLWLGGMPALLKGFLEQALRRAFMTGGREGASWKSALKGRSSRIVITMGMPAFVYRWYFGAQPQEPQAQHPVPGRHGPKPAYAHRLDRGHERRRAGGMARCHAPPRQEGSMTIAWASWFYRSAHRRGSTRLMQTLQGATIALTGDDHEPGY